ncbi:MAG TPA: prolipoprotein diacylglyceryl transferase family protein [Tepidisphaeraceae bacterium]|nr:prolipoprotein diacylglyceryl transferase family protein [Tepidisphaeraceae bacterium]
MTFPYYFHIGSLKLHPHPVMELLAYSGAFQFYWWLRRRHPEATVPMEQNLWIIVGAAVGALVGAKGLAWIESAPSYMAAGMDGLIGGKTIVGALLGGWAGVEIAKRLVGLRDRTGDLFVLPLALGMAVGRIGCFLTGLTDHTYGIATSLPWGVDFGDGVRRHPAQIYEMIFLLLWGATLWAWWTKAKLRNGDLFRIFMIGYLGMRLAIEFIKPTWKPYGGLSAIQVACMAGIIVAGWQLFRKQTSLEESTMTQSNRANLRDIALERWQSVQSLEGWAGEVRLNLIRLAAILIFYVRHLAELFASPPNSPIRGTFHAQVTALVIIWLLEVAILHWQLRRRAAWNIGKFISTTWDAAMVTVLCLLAGGPKTPLIYLFFLVIASAPMRMNLAVVWVATIEAVAGYALVLAYYAWYLIGWTRYYSTPDLRISRTTESIFILSLLAAGAMAGQVIRQVRRMVYRYSPLVAEVAHA